MNLKIKRPFIKYKGDNNLKHLSIIIIITVVLTTLWLSYNSPTSEKTDKIITKPLINPSITRSVTNTLSNNFPNVIPLEGKLSISQSYDATYPNLPVKQSTVVFKSVKSSKVLYNFYLAWAGKNNWQVVNKSEKTSFSSIYLRKATEDINITINKSEVTISYIKKS